MIQQQYQVPEGSVDQPFFYVFDGTGLTDATSPPNQIVRIQTEDFLLRSVVGMDSVAGSWRYYNASDSEAMSNLTNSNVRWPVGPEKSFPAHSQIKFDLGVVARATNADGNFISRIGWQGVKRFGKGQTGWTDYQTEYQYYESPWEYPIDINVNFFADSGAAPRRFDVQIENYDFELNRIAISETTGGGSAVLPADPFLVELFDASGYNVLSADAVTGGPAPMSPRWINWKQGGGFHSSFPTPTLVYPIRSTIRFDITSLINAAGGARTFQFVFGGVSRRPCLGNVADTRAA